MEKLCECGCGSIITSREPGVRFRQGHNTKGPKSPQHLENISRSLTGRKLSKEHREKISENNRNRGSVSELTRKKLSQSLTGHVVSEETRQKISNSRTGKRHSEETRKRMSEVRRGKTRDPEHVAKSAEGHRGLKYTPWSEESRKKMSESMKRAWKEGRVSLPSVPSSNSKWSTPTVYKGLNMRSKLESCTAEAMDSNGVEWVYEPRRFYLDQLDCIYIPDFYLPEFNIYLEVKGWDQGLEKVDVLRSMGYNVVIVRDKDLYI